MNEPGRRGPMRALLIALVTVTFFGCAQAPSLPSGTGAAAGGVGTQPSSVPMLTPGSNNAPNVTLATTDASAGTTGGPCTGYGYDCKVVPCPGGAKTTVTAKVVTVRRIASSKGA